MPLVPRRGIVGTAQRMHRTVGAHHDGEVPYGFALRVLLTLQLLTLIPPCLSRALRPDLDHQSGETGGQTSGVYTQVYMFDGNSWFKGRDMITARHGIYPVLDVRNSRIMVAGGGIRAGRSFVDNLEILEMIPATFPNRQEIPYSPMDCQQLGWGLSTRQQTDWVCSGSEGQTGCDPYQGGLSQSDASNHCNSLGARLCTAPELEGDTTIGRGCKLDRKRKYPPTAHKVHLCLTWHPPIKNGNAAIAMTMPTTIHLSRSLQCSGPWKNATITEDALRPSAPRSICSDIQAAQPANASTHRTSCLSGAAPTSWSHIARSKLPPPHHHRARRAQPKLRQPQRRRLRPPQLQSRPCLRTPALEIQKS